MKKYGLVVGAMAALVGPAWRASPLHGAFMPGNLAVLATDASGLTTTAQAVRIEQYTPAGTNQTPGFVVSLPSNSAGSNLTLSGDGTDNSDGALDLSGNSTYLTVAGYNATAGTTNVTSSSAMRIIGRVDTQGNVDLSTSTTAYSGSGIRSIASSDGTRFWASAATGQQGIVTTTLGSSRAGTVIQSGTGSGAKALHIFNGRLYGITNAGLFTYQNALPTSADTRTNITGVTVTGGIDFVMLDRDPAVPGLDSLYVSGTGGVSKFSFDGTTWTNDGTLTGNYLGIVAQALDPSNTNLYLISGASVGNSLVAFDDNSAYNAPINAGTGTTLAVSSGELFRNVELTPVPEPGTLVLMGGGAALLLRRRR